MSEKNREGKRTARERLQEQREKDKEREKRKRGMIVGGSVVAVLAIAAVIGVVVANNNSGGGSGTPAAAPAGATGTSKLVIPSGATDAPSTLTVYEDFRCPACGQFEKTYRDTVHSLQDSGQMRVDYHIVRIIDGNLGGTGSLTAGNAAACAQDQNKFREFHDVLYENQPPETDDKFAQNPYLLQLAGKVPGLTNAAFTACVNNGTYDDWIKASNADFGKSGYNSTPTVLLNGKSIYADPKNPLTPDKLKQMVAAANKGKKAGTATPGITPSTSVPSGASASAPASASASG